ncbi:hypothetical protein A2U01_0058118, partial [Trifolium medium]|nr:hypothetical protein [Trifolium medium]
MEENRKTLSDGNNQDSEPEIQEDGPENKEDDTMTNSVKEPHNDVPTHPEVVEINEETESDEDIHIRLSSIADRVRGKRSHKVEIPKSYQKEKSQKRKQESSSEFEPDDEDDVLD